MTNTALITPAEAAKITGVGIATIHRLPLPIRGPGHRRIGVADLSAVFPNIHPGRSEDDPPRR